MGIAKTKGVSAKASKQEEVPKEQKTDNGSIENARIEHIGLVNAGSIVLDLTNGSSVVVDSEELKTFVLTSASGIMHADKANEKVPEQESQPAHLLGS